MLNIPATINLEKAYCGIPKRLSTLIANSVEKIGISDPPYCITRKPLWWPWIDVLAFRAANQVVYWLSLSFWKMRVKISQQAFFQGWSLLELLTSGALSNPFLFNTVVQHLLLAIDHDPIAFGLSFESPPVCTICKNWLSIIICEHSCVSWRSDTNGTPTPSYTLSDAYQPWLRTVQGK